VITAKPRSIVCLLALFIPSGAVACSPAEQRQPQEGARQCDSPRALTFGDADTGFVRCASGFLHRHVAKACLPGPGLPLTLPFDGGSDGPSTMANIVPNRVGEPCTTDEDCPQLYIEPGDAGQGVCLCGDAGGVCTYASCRTDSECQPGFMCASYASGLVCEAVSFACQTSGDTCGGNSDCTSAGFAACGTGDYPWGNSAKNPTHVCSTCVGP
jgi:hypothetical protein